MISSIHRPRYVQVITSDRRKGNMWRWDFSFLEKEIDQSRSRSGVRSWWDCKGLTRKGSENSGVVMEFLAPRALMKIGTLLKETRLGREQIKLRQVSLAIREWSDHASVASFSRLDRVFEEASMQTPQVVQRVPDWVDLCMLSCSFYDW